MFCGYSSCRFLVLFPFPLVAVLFLLVLLLVLDSSSSSFLCAPTLSARTFVCWSPAILSMACLSYLHYDVAASAPGSVPTPLRGPVFSAALFSTLSRPFSTSAATFAALFLWNIAALSMIGLPSLLSGPLLLRVLLFSPFPSLQTA